MAKVVAADHFAGKKDYSAIDEVPASGNNYYRLTQVDKDGKVTVYGITVVKGSGNNQEISVTPNPSNGAGFTVKLGQPTTESINVRIMDITGKTILNKAYTPQGSFFKVVPASTLQNGTYLLKVDGCKAIKLVVSN